MRHDRRRFLLTAAAAAALLPGAAAAAGPQAFGGRAFGSTWRAVMPGAPEPEARAAVAAVVARIDALMSPWRADSEISGFNRAPAGPVAVSPETAAVARAALQMARDTAGAFDPTVGPIVARYGFGPIHEGRAGDWQRIGLAPGALLKPAAGCTLDLCGIAKGHALDLIMADLVSLGLTDFVFELGGEVAARGTHPGGRDWQVAIETGGRAALALRPGPLAIATSGLLEQGYEVGGRRIGHIVDPAAGGPAAATLLTATVLAPRALEADAMATALFAMGRDRALDFAAARGVAAILVAPDGTVRTTGAARDHLLGGI